MIGTISLQDVRESTYDDLDGLGVYLQQLVGEPFLFFRHSYGGELTIHFGMPKERTSPKLKNRVRGSYVLSLRASTWAMISVDKKVLVLSNAPDEVPPAEMQKFATIELEKSPLIGRGARLTSAVPVTDEVSGGIGLHLGFSDQTKLVIRPDPASLGDEPGEGDGDDLPEIADWEMFTPIDRYLRVGPGRKWAYLHST